MPCRTVAPPGGRPGTIAFCAISFQSITALPCAEISSIFCGGTHLEKCMASAPPANAASSAATANAVRKIFIGSSLSNCLSHRVGVTNNGTAVTRRMATGLPREQLGEGANRDSDSAGDPWRNREEAKAIGRQGRQVAQVVDDQHTGAQQPSTGRPRRTGGTVDGGEVDADERRTIADEDVDRLGSEIRRRLPVAVSAPALVPTGSDQDSAVLDCLLTDLENDRAGRNRGIDDKSRNARDCSQRDPAQPTLVAALR